MLASFIKIFKKNQNNYNSLFPVLNGLIIYGDL